jgi:hypothetical protein
VSREVYAILKPFPSFYSSSSSIPNTIPPLVFQSLWPTFLCLLRHCGQCCLTITKNELNSISYLTRSEEMDRVVGFEPTTSASFLLVNFFVFCEDMNLASLSVVKVHITDWKNVRLMILDAKGRPVFEFQLWISWLMFFVCGMW